ncbi:TetR family transcriptional regulator [Baekduia sp.]|jgi:AcrR family transcriptional regulator|uniref:TetR family transcriptional regulator n=1 Tax=Baekduia sp. TaxID=2600305 RepID=UPI002E064BD3|nr:TetR family transcriptional regulator [Baekduia sp.]
MAQREGGVSESAVALTDMPARAQTFHRRARIVDAAVREIAERGYAQAAEADIAARAGVSEPMFYDAFSDKQEALIWAYEIAAAYAIPQILRSLHAASEWGQGASAALSAYLDILDCDHAWAMACLRDMPDAGRRARIARDVVRAPLVAALQARAVATSTERIGVKATLTAIDAIIVDRLRHDPTRPLGERQPELAALVLGRQPSGAVDEHFAAAERAPIQEPEIETLLELGGAGDADLRRLVREAAELRDGPTLWRAIAVLQRRQLSGRHAPHDIKQLALDGLEVAWFFGLRLDEPDGDAGQATDDACYLRFVAEHPGCSDEQVRNALGVRQLSSVTRALRRLEAQGALRRGSGPGRTGGWWRVSVASDSGA